MITLNDFIRMVCENLKISVPKIQKKFLPDALALYNSEKDLLLIKKGQDNYELRFAIACALRKAYLFKNKMELSSQESFLDCNGYAYYYFDKYLDLRIEFDQFDSQTVAQISDYSKRFKLTN